MFFVQLSLVPTRDQMGATTGVLRTFISLSLGKALRNASSLKCILKVIHTFKFVPLSNQLEMRVR
jgi:hypothetical protein